MGKGRMVERANVECPRCGAPAGYPCNADAEGQPRERIHAERHTQECQDAAFMFHAATGGDLEGCSCAR